MTPLPPPRDPLLELPSIGSRIVEGGARNMKYKVPRMMAIFFMTNVTRDAGAWPPYPPPGSTAGYRYEIVLRQ